jgi:general secretion pathway protein M
MAMNDPMISGKRGQALAVALTIVLLSSLWVAVVGPVIGLYAGQTARLTEQRMVAAHMAAVAATVPALRRRAMRSPAPSCSSGCMIWRRRWESP